MFLSDEQKVDCLNEIQDNMRQLLSDTSLSVSLSFYLTSIYDHTIYEALSKVIQKLLPQVGFISALIDNLINSSKIEKAFLFDVISKIYIATDNNPVEMKHYEICSELIDVLIDVSCIYGIDEQAGTLKFDKESSSIIKLNHAGGSDDKIVLYLREVDKCLALVCLINEKEFHKQHLINYNIDKFKEGLRKIFDATKTALKKPVGAGAGTGASSAI
jgi:Ras-related GTP-binding protein C/D